MVQDVTELTNDAYLIIVYGEDRDKVKMKEYKVKVAKSSKNLLDTPLKSGIATTVLAGLTSKIGQNIAGKALSTAVLGRINSSIYDIMADGKINYKEVAEDFIGSCTNAIDNVATDMGFPTPSSLYTALMPGGTGVISKDFANLLAKNMDKENKEENNKANQPNVTVLKFKIITSDKETWGMDIPTRKTESGFEIATAIGNHNKAKDFEVLLANNTKKGTEMYKIKNQLEEIRNLKVPFDVYVNDKDVYEQYKLTNCLFSNLDFSPNGKNSLQCNMSIVEVPEWDIELVKLDSTYKGKSTNGQASSAGGGSRAKQGIGGSNKNPENNSKGKGAKIENKPNPYKTDQVKTCQGYLKQGKSIAQITELFKKHGTITNNDIQATAKLCHYAYTQLPESTQAQITKRTGIKY